MEIPPIQLPIAPIQSVINGVAPIYQNQAADVSPASFKDMLTKAVSEVNDGQVKAAQAATDLATGKVENLHEVVLSMEEAGLSLQYAIQVRNKILDAYQEISRMQI